MPLINILAAAVLTTAMSRGVAFKPIDDLLSKQNKLTYRDCELTKTTQLVDKARGLYRSTAIFRCKGKTIRTVDAEFAETMKDEATLWNRFGLVPLLGDAADKQIVMMEYTGGAHCCYAYWIYALGPGPMEIYSAEKWGLGESLGVADLDGDGVLEISQCVMAFDYFDRCCHAASAIPLIVLKYDKGRREYLPANSAFAGDLLKGTDALVAALKPPASEKDDEGGYFLGAVLDIVLPYFYAGREKEGWELFDRIYKLPDKTEMKTKIRDALNDETVYRYVTRTRS